ncbi:batten's disease protein Cln3 [Choiromyces venosus 120613-1]|uniref:Protein BTN n=1 Tax=Choiromyces venosus 120613-1 TaxID=1336337 RepID=A0A3N4JVW0_9PEZI|nr:batten's disease protein Cln3 [Choiromyces venosus 120613-1]
MDHLPPTNATIPRRQSPLPSIRLPVPGTPSSSFAVYKARFNAAFVGANPRVCAAFWLFGLINNVLYVIILSAALDLVGPTLPKAIVLLADVVPSFCTKLIAPYFVHLIPYRVRIMILVALSFVGMQLVAWADTLPERLFGVVLASISSGLGELSFLGMTHFYGAFAVPFWSSGTGGAGLIGAGLYVFATSWIRFTVRGSLMVFGFLPAILLIAFFGILPLGPLRGGDGYKPLRNGDEIIDPDLEDDGAASGLLASSVRPASGHTFPAVSVSYGASEKTFVSQIDAAWRGVRASLKKTQHLFIPYMLPLLLVYIAEYTINLGVAPTLLFPLASMPFNNYRDAYPMYNTIYQTGVFISRSSTPFIRVHKLYPPALFQVANLVLLVLHSQYNFLPNIWIIFIVVFWEGLLGGLVYVNTFAEITDNEPEDEREFSLGATTVSDSGGICVAGFISLWLEMYLCQWQVDRGRDYCRQT